MAIWTPFGKIGNSLHQTLWQTDPDWRIKWFCQIFADTKIEMKSKFAKHEVTFHKKIKYICLLCADLSAGKFNFNVDWFTFQCLLSALPISLDYWSKSKKLTVVLIRKDYEVGWNWMWLCNLRVAAISEAFC